LKFFKPQTLNVIELYSLLRGLEELKVVLLKERRRHLKSNFSG